MNDIYLRIRAKGFTNFGIEKLLARIDDSNNIRLHDSVSDTFTLVHNLSESAKKKILRAVRIARKNNLKIVSKAQGHCTAQYIIDGYGQR